MVLFSHYCSRGFSNCFIAGTELDESQDGARKREAVIIDPTQIDETVITFIESNHYTLKAVLLTHDHPGHSYGLHSLMRIYENVVLYAANPVVQGYKTTMVRDDDKFCAAGFTIRALAIPGHSVDSIAYLIDHFLFTGDALTAGLVGSTASNYAAMKEVSAIQNKILSLPGNYLLFPAHGPPTSLETERRFNAGINFYEQNMRRVSRNSFNLELLE
jgi:glyoxylase-like metal-dependent hydrolase (beta-lactamase superfamily II)